MRMRTSAAIDVNKSSRSELSPSSVASVSNTTFYQRSEDQNFRVTSLKMVPEIEQDPKSEPQPEKKSTKDRIAEQKEKCERIVHYLQHGKHPEGLTKNQQRVVRGQAKKYSLDEASKYNFVFFYKLKLMFILFA